MADWFDENDDEIQRLLDDKHRLHKMLLHVAQYPRKQPTATFVRQSRPSLGTCTIPEKEENRRNLVFCGQKGHEEISWYAENHL